MKKKKKKARKDPQKQQQQEQQQKADLSLGDKNGTVLPGMPVVLKVHSVITVSQSLFSLV